MPIPVAQRACRCPGHRDERSAGVRSLCIQTALRRRSSARIVGAQQVVAGVALPAASAGLLGVRPRTAGLQVRRYYLGRGQRLLSVSLNRYPADRFELSTQWRLESDSARLLS